MTQASVNIGNPRAWIYAQFACANIGNIISLIIAVRLFGRLTNVPVMKFIASAILVSSNLTNLVLSGAFSISYVTYTANMAIPVVFTALILLPVLIYVVFPSEKLIPRRIEMHVLPNSSLPLSPISPETRERVPDIESPVLNGTFLTIYLTIPTNDTG